MRQGEGQRGEASWRVACKRAIAEAPTPSEPSALARWRCSGALVRVMSCLLHCR